MLRWLFILLLLISTPASARVLRVPYEGIRALGMGNAFIALADDANALFYNPAALARVKGGHFNLIDATVGVDSNDTLKRLGNAAFKNDFTNLIRPDTQYFRVGVKPTVIAPYFGLALFDTIQGSFDLGNLNNLDANVDVYSFNDLGAIAGFGFPASDYFSFGFAARLIQRSGVDVHLTAQDLLDQLQADPQAVLDGTYDQLKRMMGLGWGIGLNAGALIRVPLKKGAPRWQLAATVEDIGQTTFKPLGRLPVPKPIKPSYHFGTSLQYPVQKDSVLNVALDLRNNFEGVPFFKIPHLGVEFRHRIFGVRGGVYQGYPTFGASLEFPPHTRLHFASYSVELSDKVWTRQQRWYLLQLAIGFNPY